MKLVWSLLIIAVVVLGAIWYSLHGGECASADFVGAGTTIYKRDHEGKVQLLLAFERGRGWSSFGGGPKALADDNANGECEIPEQTAIRETVEESKRLLAETFLTSAIKNAKSYANPTPGGDYITFVIELETKVTLQDFYQNSLPVDPGYYETTAITWVPLEEIQSRGRYVQTPNEQPLWDVFYQQFNAMLHSQSIDYWFPRAQ